MPDERDADFEKMLVANLTRAIEFVKYGDSKNAALLAFTSAWLAGIGNTILRTDSGMTLLVLILLYLAAAMFFVGCILALAALLPLTSAADVLNNFRTTMRTLFCGPDKPQFPNLLYFGHIQHFDVQSFADEFERCYRPHHNAFTGTYVAHLSAQTLINSKIAQRKFNRFNEGLVFVITGLLLVIVAFTTHAIRIAFV